MANYIAKLINKYSSASVNLIKALIFSSASIPKERPEPLNKIKLSDTSEKSICLFNVYGFGKPDLEKALTSETNRVLLIREEKIKVNHVKFFTTELPQSFVESTGPRNITVSIAFDPPINKSRASYLGVILEAHLFKNQSVDFIERAYNELNTSSDQEDAVPANIRNYEIKLFPGINQRKKGAHQKGIIEYERKPSINTDYPLVLAVVCRDRGWINDQDFEQDFAVVVSIEHSSDIDLYNEMRIRNSQRVRIR